MRLSPGARMGSSSGEIVQLMSNDATRIRGLTAYLHNLWSAPFQIVVGMALRAR